MAVQPSVSKSNSSQKLKLRNNILLVKRNKINIDSEYLSLKANISYAKKYSLILNKQTKKPFKFYLFGRSLSLWLISVIHFFNSFWPALLLFQRNPYKSCS